MKNSKYILITIISLTLVSCTVLNKFSSSEKYGFQETNLTLTAYLLSVKGLGKENEDFQLPLFNDAYYNYSKVKSITITHRAKDSVSIGGEENLGPICKKFNMTENELKRYFYIAGSITEHDKLKKLQWTNCYIGGSLTFENGEKATWTLNAFMQGSITFVDRNESFSVYCPQCDYNFAYYK